MNVVSFIYAATKPYLRFIAIPATNSVVQSFFLVTIPYLLKKIINAAQAPDANELMWYGGCFIALEFVLNICYRLADWGLLKYEPALRNNISILIFKQLSLQPHRFFQNNFAGAIAAKLGNCVSAIPTILTTLIYGFLMNICSFILAIIMMATVSPWIAYALMIWTIAFSACSILTMKKYQFLAIDSAKKGAGVMARCVDAITNMLGVRLFSRTNEETAVIEESQKTYLAASQKRRWFSLGLNMAQGVSFWIYQAICVAVLIWLRTTHAVTPGDFGFILMINISLVDILWKLTELMRDFADHWGQVSEALETFYAPLEVQDVPNASNLVAANGEIKFDHVRFSYPGGESLFQNKSITIPAGQKVGLVGFSGGGKSTFVNLILRLYDITSGHIFIDGQDIAQVTQASLRSAIAVVPQEPSLFHRSVYDNIKYGNLTADEKEVIEAAQQAAAHDFIIKLPQGYSTTVGERGTKLSGGQRQRIALARALIKDAPILILDEATSQLDTVTEQTIQLALDEWFAKHKHSHHQTTLVIAHRLSTLLHMDRILVFDKGKIVQDGSHTELIAQEGLYQTLWHTQVGGRLPY